MVAVGGGIDWQLQKEATSVAYEIEWLEGGAYVRWDGLAGEAAVVHYLSELQGDQRFDDLRWVLHDYANCTGFTLDENVGASEIAALDYAGSRSNPRLRVAIVTTRHDVRSDAQAYIDAGISPYPMRIFDSLDEARAWLGCGAASN